MLVSHGVAVVSGRALGIDAVAHETAMTNSGRTVGVLSTSLDQHAVPQDRSLQHAIGERHRLVSKCFPPVSLRTGRTSRPETGPWRFCRMPR